eukprot:CAMPEP_0179298812 /NCGR_PEP_ID=MMETSP0797-20121207/46187_1 /TAXON_ID=47934 /ORGANISM="Dinophysis acuminata, Strain DAEP01" /LENGTH=192 /DNA_ID=CAMNT_0021008213 /DNA_START=213 /DNA_END=787 /DNA_ORIENTATION=+
MSCEEHSDSRGMDAADIASIRGSTQTESFENAQAVLEMFCVLKSRRVLIEDDAIAENSGSSKLSRVEKRPKSRMVLMAAADIESRRGLSSMLRSEYAQTVLDMFWALNACIFRIAAAEIEASSGASTKPSPANDHARLVKFCGINSERFGSAAEEIDDIRGACTNSRGDNAQAVLARSCPLNARSLGRASAA